MIYDELPTGGLRCAGYSICRLVQGWCACTILEVSGSGGFSIGGDTDLIVTKYICGVVLGGCAEVEVGNRALDSLVAYWPLSESASPYSDIIGGLDGTSGTCPEPDAGVFCSTSQLFSGEDWITIPSDPLPTASPFTISLWCRLHSLFSIRPLFVRGAVAFGYGYLNHLQASLELGLADGPVEVFSSMTLDLERWYHVAVSWDESVVNVYVNGVLAGSEEAVGTPIARADTSIGKRCTANIQDVRVYPVAMSADWLRAEYQNYCLPGFFFTVG